MNIAQEAKWILTFLFGSGVVSAINFNFIVLYNLHIVLIGMAFTSIVSLVTIRRVKSVESSFKDMLLAQEKQQLKATVATTFNEFKNLEKIDFQSSAKYIYELEEERKKLGVNSFTEEKLKILINKIDLRNKDA
jgi:flagellar motor component MotA